MVAITSSTDASAPPSRRAQEFFSEQLQKIYRRTDGLFVWLMPCQLIAAIGAALWISPRTWAGAQSSIHPHLWAALLLGGAVTLVPLWFVRMYPGAVLTRHVIAVGQCLMSALLIHLTGGRIETHFHVFGSLAFLAFYRDWRVLLSATLVVALDHFMRGIYSPQSVFGVLAASPFRWLEHAGWVVFEDVFLFISIRQGLDEMRGIAERQMQLETTNESIERKVAERTAELTNEIAERQRAEEELQRSETQLAAAQKIAQIGSWGWDVLSHKMTWSAENYRIHGFEPHAMEPSYKGALQLVHPEDRAFSAASFQRAVQLQKPFSFEQRIIRNDGTERILQQRGDVVLGSNGLVREVFGTAQDITESKQAEAELEKVHRELLEVSRQAGMAEVATGVLHNVGNVLNSVNVSAMLVVDRLTKSRIGHLKNVSALLRENAGDLGQFFTADPKGKQLPAFIHSLAERLSVEQAELLSEVEGLTKNIAHIKDIVAVQQNYAKVSGMIEVLPVTDLVEDALQMNGAAFDRHGVEVVREYHSVPAVRVDKHKVLQILINLIRNAKYAVSESSRRDKRMTVCIGANGNNRVKITVADNGVGIETANLARIFAHGFTTKRDGHGFGLHTAALAATELGGSLAAHSDGLGHGATFTLELPMDEQAHGEPSSPVRVH